MTEIEKNAELLDKAVKATMKKMRAETKADFVHISASIKFASSTVKRMSTEFASEFRRNGRVAHIIKSYTDNGIRYEIRYRRNGYNITVTHTDLKTAKQLFIVSTFKVSKVDSVSQQAISTILSDEKSVQKCTDKKKKLIHIRNSF